MNAPNPGSDEAIDQGCTCAVLDNGRGKGCGMFDENGESLFWLNANCPLHGSPMVSRPMEVEEHEQDAAQ